jgi:hypothetical protein
MPSLVMRQHDYHLDGRCIYCLTDMTGWKDEDKTDEHIIARALNGGLIIRHGACKACAKLSNDEYENTALNTDLLVPKRILELRKSRRRGRKQLPPKPLPPLALGNQTMNPNVDIFDITAQKEQYPQTFALIGFPPPGLLSGIDRGSGITEMRVQLFNLGPKKETLNNVTTRTPFVNGPFAKMLAKIGYCYAVAERNIDGFDGDAIRDLLAGRRGDVYNFVGNVETPIALKRNATSYTL